MDHHDCACLVVAGCYRRKRGVGGGARGLFKECSHRGRGGRVKLDLQNQDITQSITVSGKTGSPRGRNNFLMEVATENMQSTADEATHICLSTRKNADAVW